MIQCIWAVSICHSCRCSKCTMFFHLKWVKWVIINWLREILLFVDCAQKVMIEADRCAIAHCVNWIVYGPWDYRRYWIALKLSNWVIILWLFLLGSSSLFIFCLFMTSISRVIYFSVLRVFLLLQFLLSNLSIPLQPLFNSFLSWMPFMF